MLGSFGEMAKLLSHVKNIQKGVKELREELPRLEFSATSADGLVAVTVTGEIAVKRMDISPEADPRRIKASIVEAVNAASLLAKQALRDRIKELFGGMDLDIPGL